MQLYQFYLVALQLAGHRCSYWKKIAANGIVQLGPNMTVKLEGVKAMLGELDTLAQVGLEANLGECCQALPT